jgi:general secretion pathway protein D
LIGSQVTDNNAGIPGLKDVPVLGALFSSQERGRRRSELIVLLSARIISDAASSDRAMADLATDMKELQARGLMPAPAQP